MLAGSLLLGLLGGGGTFALWHHDEALPDQQLYAVSEDGEVALRFAAGASDAAAVDIANLLPGESKVVPVPLQNTGELDLDVTATLTATAGSGYALRLAIDDACVAPSGFLAAPYLTGDPLAASTPVVVGAIVEGATRPLCVQITADADITPVSAMTFTISLTGSD